MIRKIKCWRGFLLAVFFIQAGLLSQWLTAGPVSGIIAVTDGTQGGLTLSRLGDMDEIPVNSVLDDGEILDSQSLIQYEAGGVPDYYAGLYGVSSDISGWTAGDSAIALPDTNTALRLGKVVAVRYAALAASHDTDQAISVDREGRPFMLAWTFFLIGALVCGISLRLARY